MTKVIEIPSIAGPIQPSPGFLKKMLSDYKLDVIGLCQYGCTYCSSNIGNYLRINRAKFADATEQQTGIRSLPADDPDLMFVWPDVMQKLEQQLAKKPSDWGKGETLVYSMLTDGFSPLLVQQGVTRKCLQLLLDRTQFRIRILTKNAIVGSRVWIDFFREHADRFVVGLSTGSLDDAWAKRVEQMTALPSRRLKALQQLQDAGIATYGMLCPVFPDLLAKNRLEELVDRIQPHRVEHVWAEPYNDRHNWPGVRAGYDPSSESYQWFTNVYERRQKELWSHYATELYVRLRDKALREGWLHKLRYLLYESDIQESDAKKFRGLKGGLLQSKPAPDGRSRNRAIAALQVI